MYTLALLCTFELFLKFSLVCFCLTWFFSFQLIALSPRIQRNHSHSYLDFVVILSLSGSGWRSELVHKYLGHWYIILEGTRSIRLIFQDCLVVYSLNSREWLAARVLIRTYLANACVSNLSRSEWKKGFKVICFRKSLRCHSHIHLWTV